MSITYIEGCVRGTTAYEATVRFLVDSGATYSLLPQTIWEAISLVPKRAMDFVLADGTIVRRQLSECYIVLPQGEGHTPVVL
jgi:predicted aspartyl protease